MAEEKIGGKRGGRGKSVLVAALNDLSMAFSSDSRSILIPAMKSIRHFTTALLFSAALCGQSNPPTLSGTCLRDGTYPQCVGGEIVFSGANYASTVHITVSNSAGDDIDQGDYTTNDGV